MKKRLTFFILATASFFFIQGCLSSNSYIPTPTIPPEAIPMMTEIVSLQTRRAEIKARLEQLAINATVAAYTEILPSPTPSSTFTPLPIFSITPIPPSSTSTPEAPPNEEEIRRVLDESINNSLSLAFGINHGISSVHFEPEGESLYATMVVEMQYDEVEILYCESKQVFVDFINSCLEKKFKLKTLIPASTKFLRLEVFQSSDIPQVIFDANWADIQDYVSGKISAEAFSEKVRILNMCSP